MKGKPTLSPGGISASGGTREKEIVTEQNPGQGGGIKTRTGS